MVDTYILGKSEMNIDAPEKIAGRARYAIDVVLPGMLHARVLRSPRPHAKILSVDTGVLRFASAGHDPTIVVRAGGGTELLMPTGMPLGLMPEATYTSSEITLDPGESIVMYTDGITEAANPEQEESDRILHALMKCHWNRQRAAQQLGISRTTLWRRMQALDLTDLSRIKGVS